MGVSVGLRVDRIWNGGSDLQASVEIYYWEHPRILAHFEQLNYPLLGPQFHPPVWSIGGPISLSHEEPGPNSQLYTQIELLGPASCPVSHWPCPGRASHAWE